jgi:hypothetical protein
MTSVGTFSIQWVDAPLPSRNFTRGTRPPLLYRPVTARACDKDLPLKGGTRMERYGVGPPIAEIVLSLNILLSLKDPLPISTIQLEEIPAIAI